MVLLLPQFRLEPREGLGHGDLVHAVIITFQSLGEPRGRPPRGGALLDGAPRLGLDDAIQVHGREEALARRRELALVDVWFHYWRVAVVHQRLHMVGLLVRARGGSGCLGAAATTNDSDSTCAGALRLSDRFWQHRQPKRA